MPTAIPIKAPTPINAAATSQRLLRNISVAFLQIPKESGGFDRDIRALAGYKSVRSRFRNFEELPDKTEKSDIISKDLRGRGFNSAGSTIIRAFMQVAGMVNGHTTDCFRRTQLPKIPTAP